MTVTEFERIAHRLMRNGLHVCARLSDFHPHGSDMVLSILRPDYGRLSELEKRGFKCTHGPVRNGGFYLTVYQIPRTMIVDGAEVPFELDRVVSGEATQ